MQKGICRQNRSLRTFYGIRLTIEATKSTISIKRIQHQQIKVKQSGYRPGVAQRVPGS
jgi:hypothetical protein